MLNEKGPDRKEQIRKLTEKLLDENRKLAEKVREENRERDEEMRERDEEMRVRDEEMRVRDEEMRALAGYVQDRDKEIRMLSEKVDKLVNGNTSYGTAIKSVSWGSAGAKMPPPGISV